MKLNLNVATYTYFLLQNFYFKSVLRVAQCCAQADKPVAALVIFCFLENREYVC